MKKENHRALKKMKTNMLLSLFFSLLLSLSSANQCGHQAGGALCPNGLCCSAWGFCGNTEAYCKKPGCQSQCPQDRRTHVSSTEQCGHQAEGALCPNGLCCSEWGFCGNTVPYCKAGCQSQCTPSGTPLGPTGYLSSIISNAQFDEMLKQMNSSASHVSSAGQCGRQAEGALCPNGECCSEWGFCGNTEPYCKEPGCQSQCTDGPHVVERCGHQAGGALCPNGECCSEGGWCGTTEEYCKKPGCQSNCTPDEDCGHQAGGALCPNGECCSEWGFCGTTEPYCKEPGCQSQCTPSSQFDAAM